MPELPIITPDRIPVEQTGETRFVILSTDESNLLAGLLSAYISADSYTGDPVAIGQAVDRCELLQERLYMGSCGTIADCINNDPDIIINITNKIRNDIDFNQHITNVINQTIIENPDAPVKCCEGSPIPDTVKDAPQIPEAEIDGCLPDNLWNAVVYLIDQWAIRVEQVFQEIELVSNKVELVALIVDSIGLPGIETIAGFVDFLNFLQEVGLEVWEVADSPDNRDRLACLIFCAFKENCKTSMSVMAGVTFTEFDQETGLDLDLLENFAQMIVDLIAIGVSQWANWVLFLGMFVYTLKTAYLLNLVPFITGEPINWFADRLKIGYQSALPGWQIICDDCNETPPCNAYTVNFTTLATSGLPIGWQVFPPINLPEVIDGEPQRWALTRTANQTLRGLNYPLYGLADDDFMTLWAAYELPEPCTITRVEFDGAWANTANSKSQSVYALTGYDFDNRIFLASNNNGGPNINTPANLVWTGNLQSVTHILVNVSGKVTDNDGSPQIRFLKIN